MNCNPLVSVVIVCYNAADYIIETLESVKAQTYKTIELIVSDDCSKDGTVEIVNEWIEKNDHAFIRAEVVTIDHNTGVSANYNRAVSACKGEWVKNVDGDDLITPNCIEDNISYISSNKDIHLIFSDAIIFSDINGNRIEKGRQMNNERKSFFDQTIEEQYKILLYKNPLPSQTCFIKKDLLIKFPYNEKYIGLEDAPMWLNLIKNKIKPYYFDKVTAYYRIHESTVTSSKRYFSPIYMESYMMFFWNEKMPDIRKFHLEDAYNYHRKLFLTVEFADLFLKNKRSFIKDIVYKFFKSVILRISSFRL